MIYNMNAEDIFYESPISARYFAHGIFKPIEPLAIIEEVCKYYKIPYPELKKRNRKRKFSLARKVCIYLMCYSTNLSLTEIGSYFEGDDKRSNFKGKGKDHTTIRYARDGCQDEMDTNEILRRDVYHLNYSIHRPIVKTFPQNGGDVVKT